MPDKRRPEPPTGPLRHSTTLAIPSAHVGAAALRAVKREEDGNLIEKAWEPAARAHRNTTNERMQGASSRLQLPVLTVMPLDSVVHFHVLGAVEISIFTEKLGKLIGQRLSNGQGQTGNRQLDLNQYTKQVVHFS
jgi:hypothetical protein